MARVLIIGAGGVGSVVAHKCAQNPEVFTEIMLASRTVSKCDAIAASIKERTGRIIETARVNADDVPELVALIKRYKPVMVINVALPYQDLTIMDACLKCGVNYMDTANYEPEDTADPEWRAIYVKRAFTTWTPPTTNRWMWRSSNTNGSGPISRNSRTPD